jgi:hypothetical protein
MNVSTISTRNCWPRFCYSSSPSSISPYSKLTNVSIGEKETSCPSCADVFRIVVANTDACSCLRVQCWPQLLLQASVPVRAQPVTAHTRPPLNHMAFAHVVCTCWLTVVDLAQSAASYELMMVASLLDDHGHCFDMREAFVVAHVPCSAVSQAQWKREGSRQMR